MYTLKVKHLVLKYIDNIYKKSIDLTEPTDLSLLLSILPLFSSIQQDVMGVSAPPSHFLFLRVERSGKKMCEKHCGSNKYNNTERRDISVTNFGRDMIQDRELDLTSRAKQTHFQFKLILLQMMIDSCEVQLGVNQKDRRLKNGNLYNSENFAMCQFTMHSTQYYSSSSAKFFNGRQQYDNMQ